MTEINKLSYPYNQTFAKFKVPSISYTGDSKKIEPKDKAKIALCAFSAAVLPVIALNSFNKGYRTELINSFKNKLPVKDKFKAILNMFKIENFSQIFATTTGGILGGLYSGLKEAKSKKDKEAKYKEGTFEFLNVMVPTVLVALLTKYSDKTGKLNSALGKAGIILTSVVGGMFIANKASNKINEKIFDKDKENKDIRHFKPADCLVHIDDLLNLAILTKIPFVNKFHLDKILPFIYARTGYEVGTAKSKN